jgi:hypothetical protein
MFCLNSISRRHERRPEPPRAPGPEGRVNSSGRRPARQKSQDAMFCLNSISRRRLPS